MASVLYHLHDAVGVITLNRPERFNSFNKEMALSLQQTLDALAADKAVRCIYITGNGKAFSAGQDLSELMGDAAPGFEKILKAHYNPIVTRLRQIEKPIIAAVNGVAAGAGANIALCCDIVVATRSAAFIQAFSKIGLIPDSGGTFILPRLVGWQKASAIMMLGDKITADEAVQAGMIYKVFDDTSFVEDSMKIANTLSRMPTRGLAYTKQALNQSLQNNFAQQLQVEDSLQLAAANTADYHEGVRAFMEKRIPMFKGE
jgi:2-(1,2-epoxy-1,2-dihydrophenyl)acetyl-CoA isomerase